MAATQRNRIQYRVFSFAIVIGFDVLLATYRLTALYKVMEGLQSCSFIERVLTEQGIDVFYGTKCG